jgi:hypothetical protein
MGNWNGIFEIVCKQNGQEIWSDKIHNHLANEGESLVLDSFFRNNNTPTNFYLGLCTSSLSDTDTLNTITDEPVGNGYARQLIPRTVVGWPTLVLDTGDYKVTSKEVTVTASGGTIGPVNTVFVCTSSDNTGKLISYAQLSTTRTVTDTSTIYLQYYIKLA